MKREKFFREWIEARSAGTAVHWHSEDTNELAHAIEFIDRVKRLVDDIPDRYLGLLKVNTHSQNRVCVYFKSWEKRVLEIVLPKKVIEKDLTFDSAADKARHYLYKLKALLQRRLDYLEEEITETEQIFIARIKDLKELD